MHVIDYESALSDVESTIIVDLNRWFSGPKTELPNLSNHEEPIYIKNKNAALTLVNPANQSFFSRGKVSIGKVGSDFLENSLINVSKRSDALFLVVRKGYFSTIKEKGKTEIGT